MGSEDGDIDKYSERGRYEKKIGTEEMKEKGTQQLKRES